MAWFLFFIGVIGMWLWNVVSTPKSNRELDEGEEFEDRITDVIGYYL